ncbi:MAG: HAMP domain-containing sensor histidine kinase [Candidatus Thermoplasmatota archaeon]
MHSGERADESDAPEASTPGPIPISDMLDILKLISRAEPVDLLIDKTAATIMSTFGVRSLVVCVLDEQTGTFAPRCVKGFPQGNAAAIRKHTYAVDARTRDFLTRHRTDQRTCHVRAEDSPPMTNDDMDYIVDTAAVSEPRGSPDRWHPLDFMLFLMVDRLGNWIGWIEVDSTADGRVLPQDSVHRIQLLADLIGIAVENARIYEDAISAMNESQGYLDLISHDIGNMINPLTYYLERMERSGTLDSENSESLSKALAVSRAAKGLVDNVRKMSEARCSHSQERAPYDLRDVLVKCISALKREFPSRDIVVSFDCPEGECLIQADELVHDLFMNLLSNAVKYNPKPMAEVEVSIQHGAGVWTVTVEDHGMGIPDDRKGAVFSRFAKRPDGASGTGMGLSIVSLLVDRYSGVIGVTDRVPGNPSEGACFEVAFPKTNGNEAARAQGAAGAFGAGYSSANPL